MGNIKTLSENLINQIAAGEVVERPASIVKELVENSIDAKANKIVVTIENGGKKLIKISDNGLGMDREDVLKAFERHATSKIKDLDDLFQIRTMGFRGEALASIASVAKVEIQTKRKEDAIGSKLECVGGKMSVLEEVGMSEGTVITVKDVFFNTPARQKFLKTDETEFTNITNILIDFALGYPWIAFKFINNGKVYFDLEITDDLSFRISQVLGKDIAKKLLNVDFFGVDPKVTGYVGRPEIARRTRQSQYVFVNGRAIRDAFISNAVMEAFHSLLPERKFPMFILFLELDPMLVDVNVHPRKTEVRFAYKNTIYSMVKGAVKATLEKQHIIPEIDDVARSYWNNEKAYGAKNPLAESLPVAGVEKNLNSGNLKRFNESSEINKALSFTKIFLDINSSSDSNHVKVLGQVKLSYILAYDGEGLFIVDQHAAHERILYQKLIRTAEQKTPAKQLLLVPELVQLSVAELAMLRQNQSIFNNIGFDMEEFGQDSFQITAVPAVIKNSNIKEIFINILDDISAGKMAHKIQDPEHEIICYTACRSAIKFGQKLELSEQIALIEELEKQSQKSTCPHGRPTMIRLTFDELEKRFGRK
ncbi:MAG: mismatch repair protein MutL, DNA mismatch repair protein MutL protein [Candidatus Peregrinibacteria bacterium GW2011_GWF2_33_10]|nr:MAG: mismatch repair protein MutL, DNA mismatch repair protein MutL protein [Candidatus Peregrinibacteria bacterium GW2011_GWF2_33_10]